MKKFATTGKIQLRRSTNAAAAEFHAIENSRSVLFFEKGLARRTFNLERQAAVVGCTKRTPHTWPGLETQLRSKGDPRILRDRKGSRSFQQLACVVTKEQSACNGKLTSSDQLAVPDIAA